jgi:hypothetical protein
VLDEGKDQAQAGAGVRAESRWPMALAVLATAVLHDLLPKTFQLAPRGVYAGSMAVLLVVLVIGDPGRIDRPRQWSHTVTGVMIALILLVNAFSAVRLVNGILRNDTFGGPGSLLLTGFVVWATNVIAFALWYWNRDGGGAAVRATEPGRVPPSFVFPEMTMPEFAPPGWYPRFADYLVLSFNTGLAFSPTDVSAVRIWAKLLMVAESLISLALAALVIARAVNIL